MLDNQFVEIYNEVADDDKKPTQGAVERWAEVDPKLDALMAELQKVVGAEVGTFNELVRKKNAGGIIIGKPASKTSSSQEP